MRKGAAPIAKVLYADVSEDGFLRQIIELAHLHGWTCAHFRPAKTDQGWRTAVQGDGKGFPDLVLLRGTRCIVAEIKSERGKLSPEQERWLEAWRLVLDYPEQSVFVWRPSMIEEIIEVLK